MRKEITNIAIIISLFIFAGIAAFMLFSFVLGRYSACEWPFKEPETPMHQAVL